MQAVERVNPLSASNTAWQGGDPSPATDGRPWISLPRSLRTHAHTAHWAHEASTRVEVSAAGSEHPSHRLMVPETGKAKQLPRDTGHGRMLYITHSHRENQNSCLPAAQLVSAIKHG